MAAFLLLRLRVFQLYRIIRSSGIGLLIVAVVVSFGLLMSILDAALSLDPFYAPLTLLVIIGAIDMSRNDKLFLKSVFRKQWQISIYAILEYSILLLPLILFQVIHFNWLVVALLLLIPIAFGLLSPRYNMSYDVSHKKSFDFIPLSLFELKFFLEKRWIVFILAYSMSFLSFIHIAFFIVSISIFILGIPEAFKWNEPREMVQWHKEYLKRKILLNASVILRWFIFPLIIALFFQFNYWPLIVYVSIALLLSLFVSINYKYARYNFISPNIFESTIMQIMLLLIFIPGGIFITTAYGGCQLIRANKNIKRLYA